MLQYHFVFLRTVFNDPNFVIFEDNYLSSFYGNYIYYELEESNCVQNMDDFT